MTADISCLITSSGYPQSPPLGSPSFSPSPLRALRKPYPYQEITIIASKHPYVTLDSFQPYDQFFTPSPPRTRSDVKDQMSSTFHMDVNCFPLNHLVHHTRIVRICDEPIWLKIFNQFPMKEKCALQATVERLFRLDMKE